MRSQPLEPDGRWSVRILARRVGLARGWQVSTSDGILQ